MENGDRLEVFIVEDQDILRQGLKLALRGADGISVLGEAADGRLAVRKILELKPDIVLMDIGLPFVDGIQATREVKSHLPDSRVLMLTSHDDDNDIFAAFAAGADGYCLKEVTTLQLLTAIRSVAGGVGWLDPAIAHRVLACCSQFALKGPFEPPGSGAAAHKMPSFTSRELDVLKLLVEGLTNQEIASRLLIGLETAKTHVQHIMEKLSVSDRTKAAVRALRQGIVT